MWAMIVMNWVIATLITAVVVEWVITQLLPGPWSDEQPITTDLDEEVTPQ